MLIPTELLLQAAKAYEIALSPTQLMQFDRYAQTLVEWNEKMNLTAITDPEQIAIKHFLDSLLLFDAAPLPQGASIIDVGTGAGFPGVPAKIYRADLKLTLLDSLNKRITFLNAALDAIGIEAQTIHSRAEDGGRDKRLRERYDVATARAVANLRELAEYCLPFVKVGGVFVALKGPDVETELDGAKKAIGLLGGKVESVKQYQLPDGSGRAIVVIKKVHPTPTGYPRPSAKMAKKPLM